MNELPEQQSQAPQTAPQPPFNGSGADRDLLQPEDVSARVQRHERGSRRMHTFLWLALLLLALLLGRGIYENYLLRQGTNRLSDAVSEQSLQLAQIGTIQPNLGSGFVPANTVLVGPDGNSYVCAPGETTSAGTGAPGGDGGSGEAGTAGTAGTAGQAGAAGTAGATGPQGATGPVGPQGPVGDVALIDMDETYVNFANTSTQAIVNIDDRGGVGDLRFNLPAGSNFVVQDNGTTFANFRNDGDVVFTNNLGVGGDTSGETIDNAGYAVDGDDLYVAGQAGVEGRVFSDAGFTVGSSTEYNNGGIATTAATGDFSIVTVAGGAGGGDITLTAVDDVAINAGGNDISLVGVTNHSILGPADSSIVRFSNVASGQAANIHVGSTNPNFAIGAAGADEGSLYLRDSAGTGELWISDGGAWRQIATTTGAAATDLDEAYNTFAAAPAVVTVDGAEGQGDLRFNLSDTEDFIIQDGGTAFATFADNSGITFTNDVDLVDAVTINKMASTPGSSAGALVVNQNDEASGVQVNQIDEGNAVDINHTASSGNGLDITMSAGPILGAAINVVQNRDVNAVTVTQNGDAPALEVNGNSTSAEAVLIDQTAPAPGIVLNQTAIASGAIDINLSAAGAGLNVDASAGVGVNVTQAAGAGVGLVVDSSSTLQSSISVLTRGGQDSLTIDNSFGAGTGSAIQVNQGASMTGPALQVVNAGTATSLLINDTSASANLVANIDYAAATVTQGAAGAGLLRMFASSDALLQTVDAGDANSGLLMIDTNSETTDSFNFIALNTDDNGTPDGVWRVGSTGQTFADQAYSSGGADLAEYFVSNQTELESGELVSVDPSLTNGIKRAAGSDRVVGVVSTRPAFIGNNQLGVEEELQPASNVLVGLVGQLPIQVTTENGSISVGDYLTISSEPGLARKANEGDHIFAVALTGDDGSGMVNGLLGNYSGLLLTSAVSQASAPLVDESAVLPDRASFKDLNVVNQIATKGLTVTGYVDVRGALAAGSLVITGDVDIRGNAVLRGHLVVGADTSGMASVQAGETTTRVAFETAFSGVPHITVTPYAFVEGYRVTEVSVEGFTIELSAPAAERADFSWLVVAPADEVPVTEAPTENAPAPSDAGTHSLINEIGDLFRLDR